MNPIRRYNNAKNNRHTFAEVVKQRQLEINAQQIIELAKKHRVNLIEFFNDPTIPQSHKEIVERKIRENGKKLKL